MDIEALLQMHIYFDDLLFFRVDHKVQIGHFKCHTIRKIGAKKIFLHINKFGMALIFLKLLHCLIDGIDWCLLCTEFYCVALSAIHSFVLFLRLETLRLWFMCLIDVIAVFEWIEMRMGILRMQFDMHIWRDVWENGLLDVWVGNINGINHVIWLGLIGHERHQE